jgi:hypothetical protein
MPSTPTHKHLSRDERLKILTLRETGQTYDRIAIKMGCTSHQVHYVCKLNQATPRKGRGRRSKLSEDRIDGVIEWMHASSDNRSKSAHQIMTDLELPVCAETLRKTLKARGISTYGDARTQSRDFKFGGRLLTIS